MLARLSFTVSSHSLDLLRLLTLKRTTVSRPLFIEEHGLRMYLDQEGVGVELSRAAYENGDWAHALEEAYHKGRERKEEKRRKEFEFYLSSKRMDMEGVGSTDEMRLSERERQGREMARDVVEWVCGVWDDILGCGNGSRRGLTRISTRSLSIGRHHPEDVGVEVKVA